MRVLASAAAIVFLALGVTPARAQDAPRDLCANRPGRGSPPCVLDAGHVQIEASAADFTHDRQGGASADTTLYSDLALRFGVTPIGEAELAFSPVIRARSRDAGGVARATGYGDLTLAWRQSLKNPDGSGVSVAVQPFVTAPTGKRGFGAGGWQGGVAAPMAFPLPGDFSLSLTPQVAAVRDAERGGSHLEATGVVGVSHALGPISLGAELYVDIDRDPSGHTTQETFDISAAWIPPHARDTQFDLGLNTGLDHDAPDYEVYAGLAHRF